MSIFDRFKWFQKTATAILVIFMSLMVLVIIAAYSRRSGNTGLDMSKMQQIRNISTQQNISQK